MLVKNKYTPHSLSKKMIRKSKKQTEKIIKEYIEDCKARDISFFMKEWYGNFPVKFEKDQKLLDKYRPGMI